MSNLRIAELDFDQIKSNLKTYLASQSEFTDYDFEGAGLSVLLDVLAYNTHYNAYLANMVVNEMFLDSAIKRSSAVSIAKHLGYTPRSDRGAKAVVNITATNVVGSPSYITLPKYTIFTSTVNNSTYTYVNLQEYSATLNNGSYTFNNVELIQGAYYSYSYNVVTPGPDEKYVLPNNGIDTTSLRVIVQNSSNDATQTLYTQTTDIVNIDSTSKVYFLQENSQEKYEIFFGDDIIGKKLTAGNIVNIEYIITDGEAANVSSNITQAFTTVSIQGSSDVTITTVSNAVGGASKEGIQSIKFNAPLINAAANRAVTTEDYKALITSSITEAESVSVWGGEDNVPPIYGKVLISLKPYDGFTISQSTKDIITSQILSNKKVLAIQPQFIDPEYFYIGMDINVKYLSLIYI